MTGKEQFEQLKKELPYISKDGKWYQLKFYDVENNCCHFRLMNSNNGIKEENVITYEKACELYNIELEEKIPTPDQYFLKKVDEPNNTNIKRTVSDDTLKRYLNEHKEECTEVIEKLKEIIQTHPDYNVRKEAYKTCIEVGIEGLDELQKYIINPEIGESKNKEGCRAENKKIKPNHINPLDKEKAIVVYMALVGRYKEHRENIICSVFMNTWKDMFECDKYNVSKESKQTIREKQIAAFAFCKDELDGKTYEEIKSFRDTFMICPNREVPVELKKLAQNKGVIVALAENTDKHLSGFNVLVKESKYMTYKLNDVPYGLNEKAVKILLESLPTKEEIAKKEKDLMNTIKSDSIKVKHKKSAVSAYKAPYATHEFKKFMNKFTIYDCKNQELTLFCVNLCKRVGINNLSNEKPIEYQFCVGSGKREKFMKRAKGRRKANAKASKNGKGKK